MSIKIFTISFLLTSLIFSLLYMPTHLTNFTTPTPPPPKSLIFLNKSTPNPHYPISFAYLISASKGDADKVKRSVRALYHPANHYLIHMDYGATEEDHREIAGFVAGEAVFRQVGSAWTILSRSFAEYCILGWENLPRTLLLYYTNFVSSPEGYFQTLICNSETYRNTTVNHDLHYITWDTPPKQHPRSLGPRDYRRMVLSNRPFARKFKQNNVVLDRIDRDLLKRRRSQFSYGGWCARSESGDGSCSNMVGENYGVLRPGSGSRRLGSLLKKLVNGQNLNKRQCK
ncbi:hypothetical protein LguiA_024459 [Lonicera macranthoides]